ncbi:MULTISPECIES: DUF6381 family protein [Streptomyces]|jgi:hypothetical protein|uniref:DUF6381 family protein n=1 Tax=Streptomyces TaxID=1883 RepID=UPI000F742C6E|nr:DUF6381 family protein [Streptomyces sp. WAC05292]RSS81072.1 hypothetical protein EF903_29330 [Streptomyces sp. WAC05292]
MSDEKQPGTPARQMREQAEELELAAQRATDPDERRRLTDEAVRIRERIERESGPESATMDPM